MSAILKDEGFVAVEAAVKAMNGPLRHRIVAAENPFGPN
jgi:hypothetical protein